MGNRTVRRGASLLLAVALGLSVVATSPAAMAQEAVPGGAVDVEAERLFDEGRELMMQPGQLDRACETLAKSLAIQVRGDTYLNLAECHRRQGKTATSWREFGQALEHAKSVRFAEAIETAKRIRADLEAKLSSLTVSVPAAVAALPGLKIALDGEALAKEAWNKPVFRDPQRYTVTASAEGHEPFTRDVVLGEDSDKQTITIALDKTPAAAASPEPPPPPEPPPVAEPTSGGVHPLAIVGFAVGGAGLVVYAVLGGLSLDRRSEFDERCPDDVCPAGSEEDIDEAILFADVATVGLAVGLAGIAAGVVGLFLDTGGDAASDDDTAFEFELGPGSFRVRGTF